ncbi:ATP-grasp domain-containing protein [Aeoliella sp.]|uniref:ATP-grasp domain-containing protein n=1 Tax=Aeoliella sp. TaxID=2795800 RepID=UPI003CCBEFD6
MNVHWLIDAELFGHYRDDLVEAIREVGDEVQLVQAPSPPYRWDDVGCSYRETFPEDACVVSHGDIELVTRIHREQRWKPGAFCTVENFRCSSYLCHFGKYWVNADYMMLPFGELTRQRRFLFEKMGTEGRLFIRPDSPLKLFTGQIATEENFDADLEFMGFYDFPPESMVVVSSPKTIVNEWRFVVAAKTVVAGCLYQRGSEKVLEPDYDPAALQLASQIASSGYEPDPVWIVDICETSEGDYHMLEIGGFSFSDLYACDKREVVVAVSRVAKLVWQGCY